MILLQTYVNSVSSALERIKVTDINGNSLENEKGLSEWGHITRELKDNLKTMYFIGNGASAMMASHMAADASKNGEFRCLAFNDAALMTAVSNDINYEYSFAMPLKRFANSGDILVTISSSGNSPNIIKAIEVARELGIKVVTISGMSPDNRSRTMLKK